MTPIPNSCRGLIVVWRSELAVASDIVRNVKCEVATAGPQLAHLSRVGAVREDIRVDRGASGLAQPEGGRRLEGRGWLGSVRLPVSEPCPRLVPRIDDGWQATGRGGVGGGALVCWDSGLASDGREARRGRRFQSGGRAPGVVWGRGGAQDGRGSEHNGKPGDPRERLERRRGVYCRWQERCRGEVCGERSQRDDPCAGTDGRSRPYRSKRSIQHSLASLDPCAPQTPGPPRPHTHTTQICPRHRVHPPLPACHHLDRATHGHPSHPKHCTAVHCDP